MSHPIITTHIVSLPLGRELVTALHNIDVVHNVLVEVEVDGMVGSGYCVTFDLLQAQAARQAIHSYASNLVTLDPLAVRTTHRELHRLAHFTGASGINRMALSAIDTASWDLVAQAAGMPLYRLLGGGPTSLDTYATGGWISYPPEELAEEALRYAEAGFWGYKLKVGSPDWRVDLERVTMLRSVVGDDFRLLIDANQGWDGTTALQASRAFDELGLTWIEEPVVPEALRASARVRDNISTALATGESLWSVDEFELLAEAQAADVLMPDLMRLGGITGMLSVYELADRYRLAVSPHCFTEVSAHVASAMGDRPLLEYMPVWWDVLFDEQPRIADGKTHLPSGPGLGFGFSAQAKRDFGLDEGERVVLHV